MPRAKGGFKTRRRHKRLLKMAKGYWGRRGSVYNSAKENVDRALAYAFGSRKVRKREFRSLWIARINAAVRPLDLSYSRFVHGLAAANVELDRRVLADLAVSDPKTFETLAGLAKQSA